ncbi:hypothetical protein RFI_19513, partial [Reticulomyxa filosa]
FSFGESIFFSNQLTNFSFYKKKKKKYKETTQKGKRSSEKWKQLKTDEKVMGSGKENEMDVNERLTTLNRRIKEFFQENSIMNDMLFAGTMFEKEALIELSQQNIREMSAIGRLEFTFEIFKHVMDLIGNTVEQITAALHGFDGEMVFDPFEMFCQIASSLLMQSPSTPDTSDNEAKEQCHKQMAMEHYLQQNHLKLEQLKKYLDIVNQLEDRTPVNEVEHSTDNNDSNEDVTHQPYQQSPIRQCAQSIRQREQIALELGFPTLGQLSKLTLLWHSCFKGMQQKSVLIKILAELQRQFVLNVFGEGDKNEESPVSDIYWYLEDKAQLLQKSVDMLRQPNDRLETTYTRISDYYIHSPKHVLPVTPHSKAYENVIRIWKEDIKMYLTPEDHSDLENIANCHPLLVNGLYMFTHM